jgi:RNA polymerase sigma-70 factor (ECF subfamily)
VVGFFVVFPEEAPFEGRSQDRVKVLEGHIVVAEERTDAGVFNREEELEMIISEHEAGLLRYATRLLNDPNTAKDVVQGTFIKLCQGWQDGARPAKQLKGWLYRVTHNGAVDYIRKESRLKVLHETQAEETGMSEPPRQRGALQRKEAMDLALEHMRKLKPEEQQVVILRLQEGMSYREIAEVTKRSEGNVGCILHHAVKKLAKSLKQAGVV